MFIIIPRRVSTVQIPDRFASDYSEVPTEARGSPTKVVGQPGLQNKPLSQKIRAQKTAQPVKALAIKSQEPHGEGENNSHKLFSDRYVCAVCVLTHT